MRLYETIINPTTGKSVSICGKIGKELLDKYEQYGGSTFNSYEYIKNPISNEYVSIYSKSGKTILSKFIDVYQIGGSLMPPMGLNPKWACIKCGCLNYPGKSRCRGRPWRSCSETYLNYLKKKHRKK